MMVSFRKESATFKVKVTITHQPIRLIPITTLQQPTKNPLLPLINIKGKTLTVTIIMQVTPRTMITNKLSLTIMVTMAKKSISSRHPITTTSKITRHLPNKTMETLQLLLTTITGMITQQDMVIMDTQINKPILNRPQRQATLLEQEASELGLTLTILILIWVVEQEALVLETTQARVKIHMEELLAMISVISLTFHEKLAQSKI